MRAFKDLPMAVMRLEGLFMHTSIFCWLLEEPPLYRDGLA